MGPHSVADDLDGPTSRRAAGTPLRPATTPTAIAPQYFHVLALQRLAGNAAVSSVLHAATVIQRCGPIPCGCSDDERAAKEDHSERQPSTTAEPVQRAGEDQQEAGGTGTRRPLPNCLPPSDLSCDLAVTSPGNVTSALSFPVGSSSLTATERAEVDATARVARRFQFGERSRRRLCQSRG